MNFHRIVGRENSVCPKKKGEKCKSNKRSTRRARSDRESLVRTVSGWYVRRRRVRRPICPSRLWLSSGSVVWVMIGQNEDISGLNGRWCSVVAGRGTTGVECGLLRRYIDLFVVRYPLLSRPEFWANFGKLQVRISSIRMIYKFLECAGSSVVPPFW